MARLAPGEKPQVFRRATDVGIIAILLETTIFGVLQGFPVWDHLREIFDKTVG